MLALMVFYFSFVVGIIKNLNRMILGLFVKISRICDEDLIDINLWINIGTYSKSAL